MVLDSGYLVVLDERQNGRIAEVHCCGESIRSRPQERSVACNPVPTMKGWHVRLGGELSWKPPRSSSQKVTGRSAPHHLQTYAMQTMIVKEPSVQDLCETVKHVFILDLAVD